MASAAREQANWEAYFAKKLAGDFNQRFQFQTGVLSYLDTQFKGLFDQYKSLAETGFLPGQENTLRGQVTDTNARTLSQAEQALQSKFASTNGAVSSGAQSQAEAQLISGAQQDQSSGQRQVTLFGANQRLTGMAGEGSALSGETQVGALANPAAYGQEASQTAHNSVGDLINTKQPSMWGKLLSGLIGGALSFIPGVGPILGGLAAGGLGGLFGGGGGGGSMGNPSTGNTGSWDNTDSGAAMEDYGVTT